MTTVIVISTILGLVQWVMYKRRADALEEELMYLRNRILILSGDYQILVNKSEPIQTLKFDINLLEEQLTSLGTELKSVKSFLKIKEGIPVIWGAATNKDKK